MDEIKKNLGIIIPELAPEDWVAGVNSQIIPRVSGADWTKYYPDSEAQSNVHFDTFACASFSALHTIETQLNWLYVTNQIPKATLKVFQDLGFIQNNKFKASARFTAKMSGTTPQGNTMKAVWDSIRKDGMLPDLDLPFIQDQGSSQANWDLFYKDIPQNLKDKAKKILDYINFQYHWISYNSPVSGSTVAQALKTAPVQIGIQTCSPWVGKQYINSCSFTSPNHCIEIGDYDGTQFYPYKVLDQYPIYTKQLSKDYTIPFVFQGVVSLKQVDTTNAVIDTAISLAQIKQPNLNALQILLSYLQQLILSLNMFGSVQQNMSITKVFSFLSGYKTYISCVAGVLVLGAAHFGYIDGNTALQLLFLFGFSSVAALRAAITKSVVAFVEKEIPAAQ